MFLYSLRLVIEEGVNILFFNVKKEDVKEDNIVYFTIGNKPTLIPSKIVRIV